MKYELLKNETKITNLGEPVYRIRALKDFSHIKKGDLGGYIAQESNLSHYGNCWVFKDAEVFEYAKICENAQVFGYAKVFGTALVCGDSRVYGDILVYGSRVIKGIEEVCGITNTTPPQDNSKENSITSDPNQNNNLDRALNNLNNTDLANAISDQFQKENPSDIKIWIKNLLSPELAKQVINNL